MVRKWTQGGLNGGGWGRSGFVGSLGFGDLGVGSVVRVETGHGVYWDVEYGLGLREGLGRQRLEECCRFGAAVGLTLEFWAKV